MMPVNHRKDFERSPHPDLFISVVIPNQVGFDEVKIPIATPEDALSKSQHLLADIDGFVATHYGVTRAAYLLYKELIKDPTCRAVTKSGKRCDRLIPWHRLPTRLDGFEETADCHCDHHQCQDPSCLPV